MLIPTLHRLFPEQVKLYIGATGAQYSANMLEFFASNGAGMAFLSGLGVIAVPHQTPGHTTRASAVAVCDCDEAAATFER
jgi:hypothetical protein